MSFFEIAVIQARRIPAFDAILAALASLVYLYSNSVADLKLIDAWAQRRDGACVLVPHDELPSGLSLKRTVENFNVGPADRRNFHFQDDLGLAQAAAPAAALSAYHQRREAQPKSSSRESA
jgi:hypothetical protein